jgi:tetratricopeptide (TPR) repeat protein
VLAWCWGDLDTAAARTAEAAAIYERLEHPFGLASVEHRRGLLALARSDVASAQSAFERSLELRERTGESRGSAFVHHDLARVALVGGRPDDARAHLRQGLDLAVRHGADLIAVLFLEAVAAWRSALGAHLDAAELLAASAAWRQRQGVPVCPVNGEREASLRARIERGVAPDELRTARARGSSLDVAAAVAWARTLLDGA